MNINKLTAVLSALVGRTNAILRELGRESDHRATIPDDAEGLYAAIIEEDKLLKRFQQELDSRNVLTKEQTALVESIIVSHDLQCEEISELERKMIQVKHLSKKELVVWARDLGIDPAKHTSQLSLSTAVRHKLKMRDRE